MTGFEKQFWLFVLWCYKKCSGPATKYEKLEKRAANSKKRNSQPRTPRRPYSADVASDANTPLGNIESSGTGSGDLELQTPPCTYVSVRAASGITGWNGECSGTLKFNDIS